MADKTTHGRTTINPQREPGARYYADNDFIGLDVDGFVTTDLYDGAEHIMTFRRHGSLASVHLSVEEAGQVIEALRGAVREARPDRKAVA